MHGPLGGLAHKESDQKIPPEEIQHCQRNADQPHNANTGAKALLHTADLSGADILRGVVGHTVAKGRERGDHQIVQLYRGGIARNNSRAKAVDNALNDDVAHRDKALLQGAGNGHTGKPL